MIEFVNILKTIGNHSLEYIWFPLLVWTVLALPLAYILHRTKSIPSVYQYHGRVALLLALPVGMGASYILSTIGNSSQSVANTAKFLVVQNPISVSGSAEQFSTTSLLTTPNTWIGILTLILIAGAFYLLLKIISSFVQLKKLEGSLSFQPLYQNSKLISHLPETKKDNLDQALIAFSEEADIPFTFGWLNTKIVIPENLQGNPETLAMAVQHELMHIKHHHFLLNCILLTIKALFWIHPLTHYLYNSSQEYREITCDNEVLADNHFSKKRYAAFLFELAKRQHRTTLAMSMAVNPSTLKKRIQIMSEQTLTSAKFRSSFLLTLVAACILVIAMACSDMQDNGITNTEIQQTQSQMAQNEPSDQQPLFVLNGEQVTSEEKNQKLSRIKPKYIKSINVLKDEKAAEKYGEAGANGVVEIFMWDEAVEKAFTDLQEKDSSMKTKNRQNFFVVVEDMPELEGGLASLQKKINYPAEAKKAGIEGKVIVQFIVNEQGEVEQPQVIRGIGGGCDKEALRVVEQATFTPGKQNNKPVRVQYSLPITYRLSSGDQN